MQHPTFNPLRIALYSHDTQGLGHIRRNLAIAEALAAGLQQPALLLISGAHIAGSFELPTGADFLTLPAIGKNGDGQYHARTLSVSLNHVIEMRAAMISAALTTFAPDVLIVDKVPYGALGELIPALKMLRTMGKTRCVLGLRDVLDDPITTRQEWQSSKSEEAIQRYYDAIWIYGDPTVYDSVIEYGLTPAVTAKVRYTGYLNRQQNRAQPTAQEKAREAEAVAALELKGRRLALCAVGGGQDGYPVAHAFAQATLPEDTLGLLLAGPFMPEAQRTTLEEISTQRSGRSQLKIVDFTNEPGALLQRADAVVAMGGYNTTCEILAAQKHALLVPRVTPRLEQWIRAQRLSELGLLDIVHPDHLSPARISAWLHHNQRHNPGAAQSQRHRYQIDLNGLSRLPQLLLDLLTEPHPPTTLPVQPSLPTKEGTYAQFTQSRAYRLPA